MDTFTALWGLFQGNLSHDDLKEMLHGAVNADFTAWSLKIGIVWWLMSGKVKKELAAVRTEFTAAIVGVRSDFSEHFTMIEAGFKNLATEMKGLKDNVTKDLTTQTEILGTVKTDLNKLTIRVDRLETKKED